ncbi:trigger factor [Candidatus Uhrbacteria bacterium]|jgi:trigger factor|nr:trigger factor [Candidatus Uhrbacteria bacterium]
MTYKLETEGKKATFTITVPQADVEAAMKRAAERISQTTKIDGFRPGKANYEAIKKNVGEMKLLEECTEELIRNAFVKASLKENLETVGQPYFDMIKMAPGNDMVFTAEVALMPKITKLADYEKLSVKKESTEPSKELIEQARADLARMQTKEVRRPSGEKLQKGDKAVINLTMKKEGVVLEGGEGRDHGVYTGEGHYIKGLIEKIIDMKEGDKQSFTLDFPDDHYQKHLAGQPIDFEVEVKEIFELQAPKMDEAFAKTVGCKDLADLEGKLKENLEKENIVQESRRQEQEVLKLLASKTKFEEISDLLINQEITKMIEELKQNISNRGLQFEEYLKSINKTVADLKLDLTPDALTRVQIALILAEVTKKEEIVVEGKELDEEIDRMAEQYKDNEDAKKQIFSPRYREYVQQQLSNQKVVTLLKGKMVK